MPLVHPSAGVNYHGSMQLSRFTSSEDTLLSMLEQLLFRKVAASVPLAALTAHPTLQSTPALQFWGRRASTLDFWDGLCPVLCVALLVSGETVEAG